MDQESGMHQHPGRINEPLLFARQSLKFALL
jgi:hypothetical protein